MLAGQPLTVYGDGSQTRDYVFVKDVARANVLASSVDLPPVESHESRAFNVATSAEMSVLELAEAVGRALGRKPEVQLADPRAGELSRSSLETAKARRILGWTPQYSFADGLSQLVEWFRGGCS